MIRIHERMPLITTFVGTLVLFLGFGGLVLSGFRAQTTISTIIFGAVILLIGYPSRRKQRAGQAFNGAGTSTIWGLIVAVLGVALTGAEVFQLADVAQGTAEFPVGVVSVSLGWVAMFVYSLIAVVAVMTPYRPGPPPTARKDSEQ